MKMCKWLSFQWSTILQALQFLYNFEGNLGRELVLRELNESHELIVHLKGLHGALKMIALLIICSEH